MSKLGALKKIADKKKSAPPPSAKALSDMVIGKMVSTSSALGVISSAVDPGWSVVTVRVVPGVNVDVKQAVYGVIDVSGPTLAREVASAANRVYHMVTAKLEVERMSSLANPSLPAHRALGLTDESQLDRPTVNVAVALRLLEAQGWRLSRGCLLSPAWVFPSMTLTMGGFEAMVMEESHFLALTGPPEPVDEPSPPAEELSDWDPLK